jgi:hypothetical protein
LGGDNNVFKVKKYCFLTEKRGCDSATSPLYEPLKKILIPNVAEKNILILVEEKKNNLF